MRYIGSGEVSVWASFRQPGRTWRLWPFRPGHSDLRAPARLRPRHHGFLLRRTASRLRCLSLFHRAAHEQTVNPEPFLQLDRVIHEKGRLAIMSMLAASPELSFTD